MIDTTPNGLYGIIKMEQEIIKIGNPKTIQKITSIAKKKYRVLIQERITTENDTERMRSFTIHDFTGKTNIDSIKRKLQKKV